MNKEATNKLKAALWYRFKMGFSVIPAKQDKKPLVSWEKYQKEMADKEQIEKWWGKDYPGANIAIITGALSNLTVIDIDTDKGKKKIEEITPDNFITPIVLTPSGGEHRYCLHNNAFKNAVRFMPGVDIRSEGGYVIAPPSANNRGAWKWSDSCSLKNIAISNIPLSYKNIYTRYLGTKTSGSNNGNNEVTESNKISFEKGSRDDTLFHLANCLTGRMPEEEIKQYLTFIAKHCEPPFSQKEINAKIQSALKREEAKQKSIAQEVREFISVTQGNFRVTEVQQTVTGGNKAILMQLSRLVKDGLIERIPNQTGVYRKIEGKFQTVRLDSLEEGSLFDIRLPFGIEQYLEIMPKDLIVFAGVPNAGKTAIMLETCRLNMRRYKCFYFSSEMGAHNCKRRISKHDSCTDWPFEFVDDFPNFVDIIQPDNINFIDYIEETEGEAYRIPGLLAKIQRKLKNGIAVVALQKNPDKEYAIGGHQTKAKPALYCTIDSDYPGAVIRIVKAKNYREENPNGYMMRFKIVKGIILIPEGTWRPEV